MKRFAVCLLALSMCVAFSTDCMAQNSVFTVEGETGRGMGEIVESRLVERPPGDKLFGISEPSVQEPEIILKDSRPVMGETGEIPFPSPPEISELEEPPVHTEIELMDKLVKYKEFELYVLLPLIIAVFVVVVGCVWFKKTFFDSGW